MHIAVLKMVSLVEICHLSRIERRSSCIITEILGGTIAHKINKLFLLFGLFLFFFGGKGRKIPWEGPKRCMEFLKDVIM